MRSKEHKILLIAVKYSTWLLAAIYFTNTILLMFNIYSYILSWIGFTAVLPLLILLIMSWSLQFCIWHRLPLYYIFICNIFNLISWEWLPTAALFATHFIIFGFLILLGAYLKNKYNEKVRSIKDNST